jgi:DNA-binding transcriptional regulator YhcF (GntR family)
MTVALRLEPGDPTPPYEQLRRQLATAIESGLLAPESRLPTVRQLAADLGVAAGTVMRAYAELEGNGLVVTRRGGGTSVSSSPRIVSVAERQRRLAELVASLVAQGRRLGAADDEIRRAVDRLLG